MGSNDLTLKVGFDIQKFQSELNKTTSVLNNWGATVQKSLMGVAAGFSALKVAEFALDVSKLAGEAEGVRAAFDKLPNSVQLMSNLKEATKGTVSELELMKRAVMASNFDISLEALPRLLEFAAVRAKQTGQSVDYLVDSIVTGIGRKSKLILDNLGISAVQLTEALGGASTASSSIAEVADAVGKIAEEALGKMGSLSENNSTKLERLAASWINVKVAIGDAANGTGLLGQSLDMLTKQLDLVASKNLSWGEKLASFLSPAHAANAIIKDTTESIRKNNEQQAKQAQVSKEADRALATFGTNMEAIKKAYQQHIYFKEIMAELANREVETAKKQSESIENIANLEAKLTNLKEEQTTATGRALIQTNLEIQAIEKKIEALKKLGLAQSSPEAFPEFGMDWDKEIKAAQSWSDTLKQLGKSGQDEINLWYENWQTQAQATSEAAATSAQFYFDAVNQKMQQAAQFGAAIGDALGQGMSGIISQAQMIKNVADQIVNELYRIAVAAVIKNATLFGGPAGVALAVAGLTALRALFSSVLKGGGASSASSGGMALSSSGGRSPGNYGAMQTNIQLSLVGDLGKIINAEIVKENRRNSRVKVN